MGLLREQAGRSNSWPALRKALHLVVDEMPEHEIGAEPSDMAYVYSGYAPLSVRVLGLMSRADWQAKEEMLRALPGNHFEATQAPGASHAHDQGEDEDEGELLRRALQGAPPAGPIDTPYLWSRACAPPTLGVTGGLPLPTPRICTAWALYCVCTGAPEAEPPPAVAAEPAKPLPTLVFFIGGCTYAELAAVRWLGRHESPPREYIVATTHLCNGDDIVQSLVTSLENNLTRL